MTKWNEETDVIVVGSGIAGLCAAIEAAQAGAAVMVFEKMKLTGGNSRISDGGLSAPNTFLQRQYGIEDSPELFYQDMMRAGLGLNHPPLLHVLAENGAAAIEWTRETLGIDYQDRIDRFGGHSVARTLTTRTHGGAEIIKAQVRLLKQLTVPVHTGCRLKKLLQDKSGGVRGVRIETAYRPGQTETGEEKTVHARRAVVLATGGFGNDVAFRMLNNPGLTASLLSTNHRGATAEGLIAGLKINAAPVHLSWVQLGPWGCADESGYGRGSSFASYAVYTSGIVIDPESGARIVNEWADRRIRADALLNAGHACLGIVDAVGARKGADSLEPCLKSGKVKAFENVTDLAASYGINSRRLKQTIEEYNGRVREGRVDAFGKDLKKAAPLGKPPFYAIRLWPKVHYTPGGLAIDKSTRVIDLESRPIPRLFAAGEVCGGIHGAGRLGGCALVECIVFGRIAGRQAAAMPVKGFPEKQK